MFIHNRVAVEQKTGSNVCHSRRFVDIDKQNSAINHIVMILITYFKRMTVNLSIALIIIVVSMAVAMWGWLKRD